jgi:PPM family protein phosphatase
MATDPPVDTAEFPAASAPTEAPRPAGPAQAQVELAALSHPGHVRPNNEDSYFVARSARSLQTLLTNLPAGHVADRFEEAGYGMLVADGMGGMAAGEVASRLAVSTLISLVLDTPDWIMRAGEPESERLLQRITERYYRVDAALKEEADAVPSLKGMGTTMTLAFSLGRELFLGHVGDSRAYLRRGDALVQLTRDHTFAQALADIGVIRADEVTTHHLRHALTRALGGRGGPVKADVQRLRLRDGDQVLLCSDGLTDMVEDAAIGAVLGGAGTAADACQALLERALATGGKDNVTVVLARYRFAPAP